MIFTDTHTHLYLDAFNDDRAQVINRAIETGIRYFFLPNIDSGSIDSLDQLADAYPRNCFAMMGLHPTSVKENYKNELRKIEDAIDKRDYCAIGEIGIDLYWDKSHFKEQKAAFTHQLDIAMDLDLPIAIHTRDSMDETLDILSDPAFKDVRGVLHCFSGNATQATQAVDLGFYLGIGGVVTFKNSGLRQAIKHIKPESLLLETDAPFLAPVPYRGQRNESAYIKIIANHLADLYGMQTEEIAKITTKSALTLFNITDSHI